MSDHEMIKPPLTEKDIQRERIKKQTEEFLKKGGKIIELDNRGNKIKKS